VYLKGIKKLKSGRKKEVCEEFTKKEGEEGRRSSARGSKMPRCRQGSNCLGRYTRERGPRNTVNMRWEFSKEWSGERDRDEKGKRGGGGTRFILVLIEERELFVKKEEGKSSGRHASGRDTCTPIGLRGLEECPREETEKELKRRRNKAL